MALRDRSTTIVVLVALIGVGVSLAVASGVVRGGPAARSPSPRPDQTSTPVVEVARTPALDVLHSWDRSRAEAYASGSVPALRRLYTPASSAGRADVALLRRYLDRGLVVRGMRMQVLAARVVDAGPDRVRFVVTDRLAGAEAVGDDVRMRLPAEAATTREIVVRRTGGAWRMASVRMVHNGL